MKKGSKRPLVIAGLVLVVLCVLLYFISPWAPLALLGCIAILAPIFYGIIRTTYNSAYRDRAFARHTRYEEDGDAAALLREEQAEAAALGYRYLSANSRGINVLNQALALAALARPEEAAEALAKVDAKRLAKPYDASYEALRARLQAANSGAEQSPPPAP